MSTSAKSLTAHYGESIAQGLTKDPEQRRLVLALERVGMEVVSSEQRSLWRRICDLVKPPNPIEGLYIWGGVGRGKTYLMDMFFHWLPIQRKRRLHFHRFMSEIHTQLRKLQGSEDPLREIAREFARNTKLLCFDEFIVSDIGDAMVLAGILEALFSRGVVLVATSNTNPRNLYEDGLQRARFMPAIDLIEQHTTVLEVKSGVDYRLLALNKKSIYRIQDWSQSDVEADIVQLTNGDVQRHRPIEILGREIQTLFLCDEGVVGFSFASLCETPRNSDDYIELATLFHTVVLYGVPHMSAENDGAARRFVALIDEFYDRRVNLVLYATSQITSLYIGDRLASVFERTSSRIIEMQSDEYLSQPHKG